MQRGWILAAAAVGLSATQASAQSYGWASTTGTRWGDPANWSGSAPGAPIFLPTGLVDINSNLWPVPGMPSNRIIDVVDAAGGALGVSIGSFYSGTTIRIPAGSLLNVQGAFARDSATKAVIVSGTFTTTAGPYMDGEMSTFGGSYVDGGGGARLRSMRINGAGSSTVRGTWRIRDSLTWAGGDVVGAFGKIDINPYVEMPGLAQRFMTCSSGSWTDGQWVIGAGATLNKTTSGTVELMREVTSDGVNSLTNNGVIDIQGGELQLWGQSTHTGFVFTTPTSRLRIRGGSHSFGGGSSTSGNFTVDGGTVNWQGAGGVWTLNPGSTFIVPAAPADGLDGLAMSGAAMTLTNPILVKSRTTLSNSSITGGANANPTTFTNGLDLTGAGDSTLGVRFGFTGETNWRSSAGNLNLTDGIMQIGSGSTFTIEGDRTLSNGTINVNPSGTLRKTAGSGITTINTAQGLGFGVLNNSGTVSVSSGTLRLAGGGTHSGLFTSAGTGNLQFIGGTHTMANGSSITGRPIVIDGSTTALSFSAGANATGAQLIAQNGGILNINGSQPSGLQNLVVNNAVLGGTMAVGVNNMSLTNGSLGGFGQLSLVGTSTFTQTAGNFTTWNKLVLVGGTLNLEGTGDIIMSTGSPSALGLGFGGVVNFNSAKTIREPNVSSSGNGTWNINSPGPVTLGLASASAGNVQLGGTVNVNSGSLVLNVGGTHTGLFFTPGGPMVFNKGAHNLQGVSLFGQDFRVTGSGSVSMNSNTNVSGTGWTVDQGQLSFLSTSGTMGPLVTGGSGTVTSNVALGLGDPATLGQSTLNGTGSFLFQSGATINGVLTVGAPTTFAGSTTQNAQVNAPTPGSVTIPSGANYTISGDSGISSNIPVAIQGTLRKTNGVAVSSVIGTANVTGTVSVTGGGLAILGLTNISGGVLTGGSYQTSGSGTLTMPAFTTNRAELAQANFSGNFPIAGLQVNEGRVLLSNNTYSLNTADLTNKGEIRVDSGTLDLMTNSRSYTQTAGTTRVNGAVSAASMKLYGGTAFGNGSLTANSYDFARGNAQLQPGSSGNGTVGALTLNGSAVLAGVTTVCDLNSTEDDGDYITLTNGGNSKSAFPIVRPMPGFNAAAGTRWRIVRSPVSFPGKMDLTYLNTYFFEPSDQTNARGVMLLRPAEYANVKLTVAPEGYAGPITGFPVKIELRNGAELIFAGSAFPDSNGVVNIPTFAGTELTVLVSGPSYLRKDVGRVLIFGGQVSLGTYVLKGGDVDGDNEVTILDYLLLSAAYESVPGAGTWNPSADIDGDLEVTILDYLLLSGNYEVVGD